MPLCMNACMRWAPITILLQSRAHATPYYCVGTMFWGMWSLLFVAERVQGGRHDHYITREGEKILTKKWKPEPKFRHRERQLKEQKRLGGWRMSEAPIHAHTLSGGGEERKKWILKWSPLNMNHEELLKEKFRNNFLWSGSQWLIKTRGEKKKAKRFQVDLIWEERERERNTLRGSSKRKCFWCRNSCARGRERTGNRKIIIIMLTEKINAPFSFLFSLPWWHDVFGREKDAFFTQNSTPPLRLNEANMQWEQL